MALRWVFYIAVVPFICSICAFFYYMDIAPAITVTPLIGFGHSLYRRLLMGNYSDIYQWEENSSISIRNSPSSTEKSSSGFRGCKFPKIDPYDPSIQKYVNWRFAENFRNCDRSFKMRSSFEKGTLFVARGNETCEARCFNQLTYHGSNNVSVWKKLESDKTKIDCEFVEVVCNFTHTTKSGSYAMLHSDLKPIKEKPKIVKNYPGKKYDLYVIVLDSVGSSSADRSLQKTLSFMEKSLEAVKFPYLNKVGQNSRPNGLALFMGKQIEPIDRLGLGAPSIKPDWDWEQSCKRYMDNESSIFQDFRDAGYRTMLTDDWKIGALNYPNCKGWKNPIVDHTMDALIKQSFENQQKKNYYGSNCVFLHREDLNFATQFINAYPDTPQFALTWMAEIVHDANEGGMVIDNDILLFLMRNRKKIENSFFVILSDHGNRLSSIVWSKIGSIDNNNPMLIMSIPKDLRTPEMMSIMRENAGKLQTHYDTRVTFLDILKYQPERNFTDHEEKDFEGEKGHSFFRKYSRERSCLTLPIPFSYCMCEFKMENVPENSSLAITAGQKLIDHVNSQLTAANLTDRCNLWQFGKVETSVAYAPVAETGAMKIIASPKSPYVKARLSALVHRSAEGIFTVGKVDRADKYGKRGLCAKGQFEALCDCKIIPTDAPK